MNNENFTVLCVFWEFILERYALSIINKLLLNSYFVP